MNELIKLFERQGTKGYRGTVLLGVIYIAVQVTALKDEVSSLHTRVAVIEARMNFPGAAVAPSGNAGTPYGNLHRGEPLRRVKIAANPGDRIAAPVAAH